MSSTPRYSMLDSMDIKCPRCGYENNPQFRFCAMCGASLRAPGAEDREADANARVTDYVPEEFADPVPPMEPMPVEPLISALTDAQKKEALRRDEQSFYPQLEDVYSEPPQANRAYAAANSSTPVVPDRPPASYPVSSERFSDEGPTTSILLEFAGELFKLRLSGCRLSECQSSEFRFNVLPIQILLDHILLLRCRGFKVRRHMARDRPYPSVVRRFWGWREARIKALNICWKTNQAGESSKFWRWSLCCWLPAGCSGTGSERGTRGRLIHRASRRMQTAVSSRPIIPVASLQLRPPLLIRLRRQRMAGIRPWGLWRLQMRERILRVLHVQHLRTCPKITPKQRPTLRIMGEMQR